MCYFSNPYFSIIFMTLRCGLYGCFIWRCRETLGILSFTDFQVFEDRSCFTCVCELSGGLSVPCHPPLTQPPSLFAMRLPEPELKDQFWT